MPTPNVGLRDIIGYVSLLEMVNLNVDTLPRRLPKKFYDVQAEKVEMDMGRYTRWTNSRQTARIIPYGSPSTPRNLQPLGSMDVKLFHVHENMRFEAIVLQALRNFTDYGLQERGKEYVTKQITNFKKIMINTETVTAMFPLIAGKVWRDEAGNILPTSSGAFFAHDFGINSSTNTGTIQAVTGATGTWDSPTCPIPYQLELMKIKAQGQHGYVPEIILYGKNIPTYLSNNDYVLPFLSRDGERRGSYLRGGFPEPTYQLFGYDWYPIADSGFMDNGGTFQFPVDPNALVMCPQPSDEWWGKLEGSFDVPTNLNIVSDLDSLLQNYMKVYGSFAFCKISNDDPVSIVAHAGNTWIYVIKNPDVVYIMTAK